jgi:hypothetical protein
MGADSKLLIRVIRGRKGGRFVIDTTIINQARDRYQCSSLLFAKYAGWGVSRQSQLECVSGGKEKKVNLKTLLRIYYAFGMMCNSVKGRGSKEHKT